MFTGIITDVGTVRSVQHRADLRLTIACGYDLTAVDLGASIACSGVCLTVVDKGDDWFAVDVSGETVARTAAAHWREGARLNLERALRIGDELGGHLVTGHVDTVAAIVSTAEDGGSVALTLDAPASIAAALAAKGSVTLDGVSLTVNAVEDHADGCRFTVNIIPHTADHTTLGALSAGAHVNLEIDVMTRYLQRMAEVRNVIKGPR